MPEPAPPNRKKRSIPSFSEDISPPKGQASEDGKICAPCVIRGVRAAKRGPSWQDLRAVRSRKAVCGAFRMHGAHILPKPAYFGCMARESCRELAIFPSEATFGMHGAQNLPRIAARERTVVKSCHGKAPENAPREYIATASRPRTHFAHILPSPGAWECIASISCHRQTSENARRRHTATANRPVAQCSLREGVGSVPWLCCGVWRATLSVRGSGHSAFSGLNCWERFRVCAVSVGNHEPASRSAKLCRIMC